MLLKQALQEVDRKTLMDKLMPEFFNLTRLREADLQHQTERLFGISLGGGAGRGPEHLAGEHVRDAPGRDSCLRAPVGGCTPSARAV